ncbi:MULTISPECIES: PhoU domain-containing protein [unclassified Lebetimonas]|uniref:PhoU domain-containing protein n=1 Tax=unclassified Lebetimonas TaxID=2648158 RepID=UPI000467956A|nr:MULTISPECIES: PhoU domain-containing protein [unclassified Lebetimonas]
MLSKFEKELNKIEKLFEKTVEILSTTLKEKEIKDDFFLIDLKDLDDEVIKFIALLHPQGEFLREAIAILKITPFLNKIKRSIKYFIKKYDFKNEKIDALHQSAITSLETLKLAIKGDTIEDAYSTIISQEKIADEIYKELFKEIKSKENIDEILKIMNVAKRLERITDSVKTITKYLLFAKEGMDF